MVAKVRELGPLDLPGKFVEWDEEVTKLQSEIDAREGVVHAK
jgi:hypothetical protein